MRPLLLALSLVLLPAGRHDLVAQELPRVVESLRPAQDIRIRTVGQAIHIGRFVRADTDTLLLEPERGTGRVALGDVDALWVRGTAARTGALIGGVAGGVGTGLFFAWIVDGLCETDDCKALEAGLVGFGIGAAAGALTGLVLGTFVDKWHRRFP